MHTMQYEHYQMRERIWKHKMKKWQEGQGMQGKVLILIDAQFGIMAVEPKYESSVAQIWK